jgi:hypothetical protein
MQKKYSRFCPLFVKIGDNLFYDVKFFLFSVLSAVLLATPNLAMSQTITDSPFLTYENPELGIKIDYPASWQRTEDDDSVRFSLPYESDSDRLQETLEINVQFLPIEDWFTLEYFIFQPPDEADPTICGGFLSCAEREKMDFRVIEHGYTQLANNPAYKVIYTETVMIDGVPHQFMDMYTVVLKSDRIYSIDYIAEPTTFNNYFPIIERMLNSLQITI